MEKLIYLDNAATSFPKPDGMHDAVRDFYSKYGVNPGRSGCDLGLNAEQMIHGTRKRLSAFFNKNLVEAGTTILLERECTLELAARYRIAVIGRKN